MTTRLRTASRLVLEILLLAAAYALVGWLARLPGQAASPLYASTLWPSAGLALGVLLTRGWRLWPGVWLGAFLIDTSHLLGTQAPALALAGGALIATGVTVQALLGRALACRAAGCDGALDTPASVLRFLLFAGLVASLVSASVGVATLAQLGLRSTEGALMEWMRWWGGDVMGVVLGTPLVLALFARPREVWGGRGLRVALPLMFAIVVLSGGFAVISRLEYANRQAEFQRDAALQIGNAVQAALNDVEEASNAMADLVRANGRIGDREFQAFAGAIHQRHPAIQSLGWLPRVRTNELGAHERGMRAAGYPSYAVVDRSAGGTPVPVAVRNEYFPLQFLVPQARNASAMGYDYAFEPVGRDVLDHARQLGRMAVSDRIRPVQEKGEAYRVDLSLIHISEPTRPY